MNKISHVKNKEKINDLRYKWCLSYLFLGVFLLFIFSVVNYRIVLLQLNLWLLNNIVREILWCLGWAAIGISIGLYNTREASDKRSLEQGHYRKYFFFVWVIATLAAFVALRSFKHDIVGAYAVAILAGVIIGFTGDKLGEKLNLIR